MRKKKNNNMKKAIIILFLIFALFSVGGKLLSGIVTNDDSQSNNENKYSEHPNSNINNDNDYNNSKNSNNSNNNHVMKEQDAKGFCDYLVDGDTIDVSGVGRIRLVGVNTPEKGQPGFDEATNFVKSKCLGKGVYLDIDDKKNKDKYGRMLAIVYVDGDNINQELLKRGYAEIMFIPPSEFNPYQWT